MVQTGSVDGTNGAQRRTEGCHHRSGLGGDHRWGGALMEGIKKTLDENKIAIPYNQLDVHVVSNTDQKQ